MQALRGVTILLFVSGGMLCGQRTDAQSLHSSLSLSDTARLEWVKHFSSGSASSMDMATDVATDPGGNVYVTGKSESPDAGRDYLTIKYSPLGQEIWRVRYDGPSHADDVPSALAVDGAGNVYVTGMSMGPATYYSSTYDSYDYATVKYNSSGQEVWVARYAGPENMCDGAVAIAVDAEGHIYVSGESDHVDSSGYPHYNSDFATIKYGPGGTEEWVARYDGPQQAIDQVAGLTVDNSGNVIVAGTSHQFLVNAAVVTVKYDPEGIEQWTARMVVDSSGSAKLAGVVSDDSGNIYIAGNRTPFYGPPSGTSAFTAKYDPQGHQEWIAFFDTSSGLTSVAGSLAIDSAGNVIVAGVSGTGIWMFWGQGESIEIFKYAPTGNLLWSQLYTTPDPPGTKLKVTHLVVDPSGNVYITGSGSHSTAFRSLTADSIVTMKYDANGVGQWVRWFTGGYGLKNDPSATAIDNAGNLLVAGGSGPEEQGDFVVIKYLPSGDRAWDARTSGEGTAFESLSAMTLDAEGNMYVTGSGLDASASSNFITAKFDRDGNRLWISSYNGPANEDDRSNAIALDRLGNVYVTGTSDGVGTSQDWTTIKYNNAGVEQWVVRYTSEGNQSDQAYLIAVDSLLDVFVAGATASSTRMTTIKYDGFGNPQWVASYDTVNIMAKPSGLCLDRSGNVYVTNPQWYGSDAVAIKYNTLGGEVWRVFGGHDILVDDSANVYCSGYHMAPWTSKYSSSGALIWRINEGGSHIEFDNAGDILFHNSLVGSYSGKITRNGTVEWTRNDLPVVIGRAFCVDRTGNSYVAGLAWQPGSYSLKRGPDGEVKWVTRYTPEEGPIFSPYSCHVDGSGTLYLAGSSERKDFSNAATVMKYAQITVALDDHAPILSQTFSLSQNYPNPFNPRTEVRFGIGNVEFVSLKVYDILGREVATLVNEVKKPGSYAVTFDGTNLASGVYFYRLESGSFMDTKKLMLIK